MKLILNRIIAGEASDEFLKIAQQDVNSSIANVSNQINDMMSFSRTKEIELTPISLYSVLASAIKQVVSVKKNVELSLEYDFNNSNMILGDESRLSSVFANLIANAIEAIQEIGKKKSGVLKFTTWKSKDYFILTIYNDGPHIPVNHLGEIFKPLFTSGKNQGTGLGLASASKIMNDHKGSIEVKNIEPTGVEFKMNFKLSIVEDAYHKEKFLSDSRSYVYKPLQNAAPDQKKVLRILLLDDDQYVYEYFLDVIKTIPYSIELGHFKDYESAKAGVVSKRYDLYILDYDLGDLKNGLDFYKENLSFLKSNVILHTNRDKRTIDYLTLDVFAKPVNSQDLTSLCDKAYNSRERILLVEDSKIISIGWKMFHGKHNINTVSSPEEALSFLETESNSIDICVLDYYFENSYMNGEELAMIIREKYPSLRILIASSTNVENNNIVSIKKTNFEIRGLG